MRKSSVPKHAKPSSRFLGERRGVHHATHELLAPARNEQRAVRDAPGGFIGVRGDLPIRDDARDEPFRERSSLASKIRLLGPVDHDRRDVAIALGQEGWLRHIASLN